MKDYYTGLYSIVLRFMSGKAPIPVGSCIICGRAAPIITISNREFAICFECVPLVDEVVHPLAESIKGRVAAKPKPVKAKPTAPKLTPEQFKEKLVEVVEKQGKASLIALSRWYRISLTKAKEIAQALVNEKGYIMSREKKNIYLEKPKPVEQPTQ